MAPLTPNEQAALRAAKDEPLTIGELAKAAALRDDQAQSSAEGPRSPGTPGCTTKQGMADQSDSGMARFRKGAMTRSGFASATASAVTASFTSYSMTTSCPASSSSMNRRCARPLKAWVSTRTPGPWARSQRVSRPDDGRAWPASSSVSALMRHWIATPCDAGGCAGSRPSCASVCPAATAICAATRSTPVTASVTGCSTCSRVFISMNQMRSG